MQRRRGREASLAFLPYKAHIREDEDVQKPIELLSDLLARYVEALQQGSGAAFVKDYFLTQGDNWSAGYYPARPLPEILGALMFPFWNNYDRTIFECEQCGRLWVETDAPSPQRPFVAYLPETEMRHVLWSQHNHNPYGDGDADADEAGAGDETDGEGAE